MSPFEWVVNKCIDIAESFTPEREFEPTPQWMEIEYREYEWDGDLHCPDCRNMTTHRFIEWLESTPTRVTTGQCLACNGEEFVFDIKGDW